MQKTKWLLNSTCCAVAALTCGALLPLSGCGSTSSNAAFGTPLPPSTIKSTFISKSDGFELFLPGTPRESSQQTTAKGQNLSSKVVSLAAPNLPVVYVVVSTPIPEGASNGDAKAFLDGVETGFLEPMRGQVEQRTDINLGGNAGREILGSGTIRSGAISVKQKLRARYFLLPGRSLQLVALAAPQDFDKNRAQIDKVFTSFRLVKP